MTKYLQEFYLAGEKLFATRYETPKDSWDGIEEALDQARDTATRFAGVLNQEKKRRPKVTMGDIELHIKREG